MATHSICCERRCGNAAVEDGRCRYHASVLRRKNKPPGKPRYVARNPGSSLYNNGMARQWIMAHVGHTGDECLIWPFSRSGGYGQIASDGTVRRAHRVMCEIAHGPQPTPRHVAAHTCGNGKEGCVNPRHLRWATQKENMADKLLHGTSNRKPDIPQNFEIQVLCSKCGKAAENWRPVRSGKGIVAEVNCHGAVTLVPLPIATAVLAFDAELQSAA